MVLFSTAGLLLVLQEYVQMYEPMVARESTAMITPCSKMKPRVVVPWQGLTISTTSRSKVSNCRHRRTA